jgi:ribosomal protein L16/L10AE
VPLIAIIKLLKKLKNKYKKKSHRLRFNILTFPVFQKTGKPKEVRMGKGRGGLTYNVYHLKRGNLIFQFRKKKFLFFNKFKKYIYLNLYLKTLKQAQYRLPFKNIFLRRL